MRRLMKISIAAVGVTCLILVAGVQETVATPIGLLISTNGSITQGNLVFANFTLDGNAFGNFSPADLNEIDVQGVTVGGEYGLRISGPSSVSADEGALSALGYQVTFTVTALDAPEALLHNFHQQFEAAVTGPEAIAQVNAQVFTNDESGSFLAGVGIGIHEGDVPTSDVTENFNQNTSSILFQHFLLVQTSGGSFFPFPAGAASIPFTDLTFSETRVPVPVPEPGTLALLATGILGIRRAAYHLTRFRARRTRPPRRRH